MSLQKENSKKNSKSNKKEEIVRIDIKSQFKEALEFHQQGYYDEALLAYQLILSEMPNHRAALMNLGVIQYICAKYDSARESFELILKEDEKEVDALYNLGRVLQAQKEYSKSLEYLEKAYEQSSDDPMIQKTLGVGFAKLGFDKEAVKTLTSYLEKYPYDVSILLALSESLMSLGNFVDAGFTLNRLLSIDDQEQAAYELLSDCYSHQSKIDKSIEILRKLLSLRKNDSGIYRKLAMYYGQIKDYSEARQCYWKAYSIESKGLKIQDEGLSTFNADIDRLTFQTSVLAITEKYAVQNNWKGALTEFSHLSKKFPDSIILLQEIAYLYQCMGEFRRSAGYYERILEMDVDNLEALLQLIRISIEIKDYSYGKLKAEKALHKYPDVLEVYELVGLFLVSFDRHDEALSYFEHCKENKFDSCGVMLGSSECYIGIEEYEKAVDLLKSAVRIFSDQVELKLNLAKSYLGLNEVKKAQEVLREARANYPENLQVLSLSARASVKSRNLKKAAEYWLHMSELAPINKEDYVPFIKSLIYSRQGNLAAKQLKAYTRFKHKNFEGIYLEAMIFIIQRNRFRFGIPWQELWSMDRHAMLRNVYEMKALLNEEDIQFMIQLEPETHKLFSKKPEIKKAIEEYFQIMIQPQTLELLK
ncbi:tetratricopeptide repeat protein [bacterium]|nr:tetratricopeptide repeat protein [bacterium]